MSKTKKAKARTGKSLVIVESPAKAKTINRYLGSGYVVKASMGHVRDLPKSKLGVDLDDNFKPTYRALSTRAKVLKDLKSAASKADLVYLATDLDREGEAIAWHLANALKLSEDRTKRVVFNEITKRAITRAFEEARVIDKDKVDAQQARRILDRIVGYQLSPLLWKKIARNLSAGRVQSVAVRLIVEREEEIGRFVKEEYWKMSAVLHTDNDLAGAKQAYAEYLKNTEDKADPDWFKKVFEGYNLFKADLVKFDNEKFEVSKGQEAGRIRDILENSSYRIHSLNTKQRQERPYAPFTTASLQQQASTRLNFTTKRTMAVAQQLYQGLDLGAEGAVALITYMRTDSTHLASEAVNSMRAFVSSNFGEDYIPGKPNVYASKAQAQEAHEAIRPTDVNQRPEDVKQYLTVEQYKLYDLIWKRAVASQMTPAVWNVTEAVIHAESEGHLGEFRATGRKLAFPGFLRILPERLEKSDAELPSLEQDKNLGLVNLAATQHFTQPPPRFNEASLVKTLEAEGIGRPSTYANIISTIQDRGYVEKKEKRFFPTPLGKVVTKQLIEHFPRVMDVKFTSHMEEQFDKIEEAHIDWVGVLHEFYDPFRECLEKASENMEKQAIESEYKCETCGKPMVYKWTKSGQFLACSGYPECKTSCSVDDEGKPVKKEAPKETDHKCPKCDKPMLLRTSRYGTFLGCSGYPECKTTIPCDKEGNPLPKVKPEEVKDTCPECGKPMVAKRFRGRGFLACTGYPDCKTTKPLPKDIAIDWPEKKVEMTDIKCPNCGKPMVIRSSRRGKFLGCSGYPKCKTAQPLPKEEADKGEAKGD